MDLDERVVKIVEEAEFLSETDLQAALVKMREALAIEPNNPNLEDEIYIREDALAKLDGVLKFIVVLLREGKEYQACKMLRGLPANYIIQDKSGLLDGLEDKIAKVEGLVEQARSLAKSDSVKALAILEESFNLVPDYPGLSEDVTAIRHEVTKYKSYINAIENCVEKQDVANATDLLVKFREVYPDDENGNELNRVILNLTEKLEKKKARKVNLFKIMVVVGALLGVMAAYFGYEMLMIEMAERQWKKVSSLLVSQKFSETQAAGREINQDLGRVRFFALTRKQELQNKVDDVLKSEVVMKGAEGKVLFDGDYIPKESLASSQEVKKLITEAEDLVAAGDYVEAISKFEEALVAAKGMDAQTAEKIIDDIKLSINRCRLNIIGDLTAKAGALITTGSLSTAQTLIGGAIAMVKKHAMDVNEPIVVKAFLVEKEISMARFRELVAGADKLFVTNNYDSAMKAYIQAHSFAKDYGLLSVTVNQRINEMVNKSKFRALTGNGDRSLASGKWQEAVQAYESGIAIATKNNLQKLPSFRKVQTNLRKAKKMQVVGYLVEQDKLAGQYLIADKPSKAKGVLLQAIKSAEASVWHDEKEVSVVLGKLKSGLAEVEETIFVADKKQFLNDRYIAILKNDFGLGRDVTLLNPEIILLTENRKLLKFRVSAISYIKKGTQGKYTRYEAIHVFDRSNEVWGLVEKSSDSRITADREYN